MWPRLLAEPLDFLVSHLFESNVLLVRIFHRLRELIMGTPVAQRLGPQVALQAGTEQLRFPNSAVKSSLPWISRDAKDRSRQRMLVVPLFSSRTSADPAVG